VLRPGTYVEAVQTRRGGTPLRRLVLRAEYSGTVVLTSAAGTVLRVSHPFVTVQGVVVDGQYAPYDAVIVDSAAEGFILREAEVRRTSRDCIDMRSPAHVVIESSLIHRCLNPTDGRADAHGIVAGAVRDLTIRDTEIHTFSGDAIQVDAGRSAPGWDRVVIERCRLWLAPLLDDENGFASGIVPGENAVDTKALGTARRASIVIRQTEAWGFRGGLITNMAAFNIKENVDAIVDGVTVYGSEIAFRLRGPGPNGGAWVRVQNAVVFDVTTAIRYEDNIERAEIWNSTLGADIGTLFQAASSNASGVSVQNVLFMGPSTSVLRGASNMQATSTFFRDAGQHDYRLAPGSPAIDAGSTLPSVTTDRIGVPRPSREHWDVGAYEFP